MPKDRPATASVVRTTGRRSTSPLLDRTSRASTSVASARTVSVSSSSKGCNTNRSRAGELPGTTSMSHAWSEDDRAPVSTLALMAATPSFGSATHSRQPMTVGDSSAGNLAVETVMLS